MDNKHQQAKIALINKLKAKIKNEERIADYLGRKPKVDHHPLLDRFVKGIDIAYKTQLNIRAMQIMLASAQNNTPIVQRPQPKLIRQLSVVYRNGVIQPKNSITRRQSNNYRWELKSQHQEWVSIDAKNTSSPCADLVRLRHEDAGSTTVSNVINVQTVIRRQSFTAKRKQYRFKKHQTEFRNRCFGVAQRILRLTTPHIAPVNMSNGFSMRIFQDRVGRLPSHLDMDVQDILKLCTHNLSDTRYISPTDANYIKMVEFCEPTIHLNPAALRRKLKKINCGHKIKLQLFQNGTMSDSSSDNSSGSEPESSEDALSESSEEEYSSNSDFNTGEEDSAADSAEDSAADSAADSAEDSAAEEEQDWAPASKRPLEGTQVRIKNRVGILVHNGSWNELEGTDIKANGWKNGKVQVQTTEESSVDEEELSDKELEQIQETFDIYDRNNDRKISITELRNQLTASDQSAKSVFAILDQYDLDNDGQLNFDEFSQWCIDTDALKHWNNRGETKDEHKTARTFSEILNNSDQYKSEPVQSADWVPASKRPTEGTQVQIKNRVGILEYNGSWNKLAGTDIQVNGWTNGKVQVHPVVSSRVPQRPETKAVPSGELSEMLMNLSDDWAESDDELNFATESSDEYLLTGSKSSGFEMATDDDLMFATSSGDEKLMFATSSGDSGDEKLMFAASSSDDNRAPSSGDEKLTFAESSSVSSDLDFATSESE